MYNTILENKFQKRTSENEHSIKENLKLKFYILQILFQKSNFNSKFNLSNVKFIFQKPNSGRFPYTLFRNAKTQLFNYKSTMAFRSFHLHGGCRSKLTGCRNQLPTSETRKSTQLKPSIPLLVVQIQMPTPLFILRGNCTMLTKRKESKMKLCFFSYFKRFYLRDIFHIHFF